MATKVGFAYGNTIPTASNIEFTDGTLYFNTSNQKIYFKQGSNVRIFDGNNNSGLVNIYNVSRAVTARNAVAAYIQNAPTRYSTSYTSSISGADSWYSLYGQGIVSSTTLVNHAYGVNSDFDSSFLACGGGSRPPLNDAREIVFAIDLMNLAKAANKGTAVSGSTAFGFYPSEIIVHCYRTSASSYPITNTSSYTSQTTYPMFVGNVSLGPGNIGSSSKGASATFGSLQIELCNNASNAVYVSGNIFNVEHEYQDTAKNTSASFYAASAQSIYDMDGSTIWYPDIEKHIYPLYIRYI